MLEMVEKWGQIYSFKINLSPFPAKGFAGLNTVDFSINWISFG